MRKEPKNPIRTERFRLERAAETDRASSACIEAERAASQDKVARLKAQRLLKERPASQTA